MARNPRSSVRRLTAAPLVLVLCEIRFSPILTIEAHIPSIQDRLRQSGFPGFEQAVEHQFELTPTGPPKLTTNNRWIFRDLGLGQVATLGTSSLNLQVTHYSQFEAFLETLKPVVDAVADVVAPAYHERIGVRYVNAVENAGSRVTDLFRESVLSFTAEELGVNSLMTTQQVVGKTDRGQVVVRMNQVENVPLLPADLLSPAFPDLVRSREGVHAILDIDGSDTTSGDFSFLQMEDRLWEIHDFTERAFWGSTTPMAHQEWGLNTDAEGVGE